MRHELIQLEVCGDRVSIAARVAVSPYPVGLVTVEESTCYVTSLWSHRLTQLSLGENGLLEKTRELDLPFAPRCLVMVPNEETLIVADSFTGRLAIVSRQPFQLEGIRTFPGHNLRGLASSTDGQRLVIAHQMLNDLAQTVRNDVHWGLLMSNDLRWLRYQQLLHDESDLYKGGQMRPLGGAGNAAADPSGVAVAPNGTVVVALGGVDEVALGRETDFSFYRIPVGKRPTAIAIRSDSERAYVANRFDDTISVVDLPQRETVSHISLGKRRPLTLVERGEQLFFSGRLSHDSWMSCHSCHTDGHTNGGLNDNFSDGSFGASKRVLSLLGLAGTAPFAWNGEVEELDTQIRNSINQTMQSDKILNDTNMASLAAYLESLPPPPSLDRLRGTLDEEGVARGETLFLIQGCVECHAPPLYTTPGSYDVGLEDSQGNRHFNPPSLRGVSQRGPYFHDNRAPTLESVFREHGHPLTSELSDAELSDLVAFLRSL
jgi:mono/diheme cytochrome c family protein